MDEFNDGISTFTKSKAGGVNEPSSRGDSKFERPIFSLQDLIRKPLQFFADKIFHLHYEN